MTQRHRNDVCLTSLLLQCVDDGQSWLEEGLSGPSWLRHAKMGAQVDWSLLFGATDAELDRVSSNWRNHVRHLQTVHGLTVTKSPTGVWRFVAACPNSEVMPESTGSLPTYPADDAPEGPDDDGVMTQPAGAAAQVATLIANRLNETAVAIVALDGAGVLGSPLLKDSVGMLIRRASECNHWHNSADYRSDPAASEIQKAIGAGLIVTSFDYQAWCRKNMRHEHVVPNSVIYRLLLNEAAAARQRGRPMTVPEVVALLSLYCKRATITVEEDRRLARAGLSRTMPDSFWQAFEAGTAVSVLGRYTDPAVMINVQARTTPAWFP